MLDFTPVREGELTMLEFAKREGIARERLRELTNEMLDRMLDLVRDCADADVTFVPQDPEAFDGAAATREEVNLPWTLGHVIVHVTASAEESAATAAELARGVPRRGWRSRYEVPWQSIQTLSQCLHRLEESRRMRLASLEMWPDEPHLDNTYSAASGAVPQNALARFLNGLKHDDDHLGQIAEIVRQARAAREA